LDSYITQGEGEFITIENQEDLEGDQGNKAALNSEEGNEVEDPELTAMDIKTTLSAETNIKKPPSSKKKKKIERKKKKT
jgi:hypothetical protein